MAADDLLQQGCIGHGRLPPGRPPAQQGRRRAITGDHPAAWAAITTSLPSCRCPAASRLEHVGGQVAAWAIFALAGHALLFAFSTAGDAANGLLFGWDIATVQKWVPIYLGVVAGVCGRVISGPFAGSEAGPGSGVAGARQLRSGDSSLTNPQASNTSVWVGDALLIADAPRKPFGHASHQAGRLSKRPPSASDWRGW